MKPPTMMKTIGSSVHLVKMDISGNALHQRLQENVRNAQMLLKDVKTALERTDVRNVEEINFSHSIRLNAQI